MKTQIQFEQFYGAELEPKVNELESKRLRTRNILAFILVICALSTVASVWGAFVFHTILVAFLILPLTIITIFLFSSLSNSYGGAFRNSVLPVLLKFYDNDLLYNPNGNIDKEIPRNSRLFDEGTTFLTHHFIECKSETMVITLSELSVLVEEKEHKSVTFNGLYFYADLSKQIKGYYIIVPSSKPKKLEFIKHTDIVKVIDFDDDVFKQKFIVYSTNRENANTIIDKNVRRLLCDMRGELIKKMNISIALHHIHISLKGYKNMFSPPVFKKVTINNFDNWYFDIVSILDLINCFNHSTSLIKWETQTW